MLCKVVISILASDVSDWKVCWNVKVVNDRYCNVPQSWLSFQGDIFLMNQILNNATPQNESIQCNQLLTEHLIFLLQYVTSNVLEQLRFCCQKKVLVFPNFLKYNDYKNLDKFIVNIQSKLLRNSVTCTKMPEVRSTYISM